MGERSSVRARLFFIAGPAAAIVWSVYAAVLTADARQRATEADSTWRHQSARVESSRRYYARARAEMRLAMRRAAQAGMELTAVTNADGGGVVAGSGTAAGAATAAAIGAGSGMPGEAAPVSAPVAGLAPVNGAALVGDAGSAGEAQGAASPAPSVAAGAATTEASVQPPALPVATSVTDSVAIARAAAAERAQIIDQLREQIAGAGVQVDEIRVGSSHEEGSEWVRAIRIQLSGKREQVKRAAERLKDAAPVRELEAAPVERVAPGEARVLLTGTVHAGHPAAMARG